MSSVLPIEVYQNRASNRPRPDNFVEDFSVVHESVEHALSAANTSGWQFWADVSEFQPVVDKTYPYACLAYRLDNGHRLDYHAKANHATSEKIESIVARIGYVVYLNGEVASIMKRLKNNFGASNPGIGVMVDMESGKDFAGPGNHSFGANNLVSELRDWTGSHAAVIGYANAYDWHSNWPAHASDMKRVLADYSATIESGFWAQQYTGGTKYPVPNGFPTACRPFGSWVDMNAKKTTASALADSLGLGEDLPMQQAEFNKLMDGFFGTTNGRFQHDVDGKTANTTLASYIANADDNSSTAVSMIAALANKLNIPTSELVRGLASVRDDLGNGHEGDPE